MATISSLAQLVTGYIQMSDLTVNDLQAQSFLVGSSSPVQITKTIAGRLVSLQNGTDVDATYHTHDTLYYRKTALNSTTGGSAGSTLIGDDNSYTHFTPSAATVKGALSGIDTALGSVSSSAITSLTGDVTATGPGAAAATVAKIQGTAVSGTTGTGNVAFSASPTFTGTMVAAAVSASGNISSSGGTVSGTNLTSGGHASLDLALTGGTMSGAINMGSNKITNLTAGSVGTDAVNYGQVILASGANAFGADQSMGGFKLTSLAAPLSGTDATNKNYVDNLVQGLNWKETVRSATTGALPSYSATAGVITASANGALPAQDGVTLVVNDRLLVKDETGGNLPNNGIYVVTQVGSGGTPFILTRSSDANTAINLQWATIEVSPSAATQTGYIYRESNSIATINVSNVAFALLSKGLEWVFSNGLSVTGNTVTVLASDSSILSAAGGISVVEDPAGAIITGGSGVKVQLEASNPTLQISSNRLGVKLDAAGAIITGASGIKSQVLATGGIQISSNSLSLLLADTSLATSGSGVQVNLAAVSGLTVSSGLKVKLEASNPTLQIDGSNQLGVKLDGAGAIVTGASGIKSQVLATGGLQISSNSLAILLQASSGLVLSGTGLAANVDGSSITINGSNQLQANLTAVFVTLTNNTGSTINAGDIVSADTTAGQVKEAKADSLANVQGMIGVAAASIANGASGKIQVEGLATVTQGASFTVGSRVYLSSATAGQGTSTAPTVAGTFVALVGVATSTTQVVLNPMLVGGN